MQSKVPSDQTKQNQSRNDHQRPHIAQAQLEDSRPELAEELQQQTYMANSPQVKQLQAMQAMMAPSPQVRRLQSIQTMAVNTQSKYSTPENSCTASSSAQRVAEDETLQRKAGDALVQREQIGTPSPQPNNTGLPDNLKTGIENLSGISMDHVRVYYNSDKPAQLQAHAYAQGGEIHVAPGQEKHLPHEAWHVVQQAQGRVKPTIQMKGGKKQNIQQGIFQFKGGLGGTKIGFKRAAEESKQEPLNEATISAEPNELREKGWSLLLEAWRSAKINRKNKKSVMMGSIIEVAEETDKKNKGIKKITPVISSKVKKETQKKRKEEAEQQLEKEGAFQGLDPEKGEDIGKRIELITKRAIEMEKIASKEITEEKERRNKGFSTYYADKLEGIGEERDLLEIAIGLVEGLALKGNEILYEGIEIAELVSGSGIYLQKSDVETGRASYFKSGLKDNLTGENNKKEYVQDSRGVYTRRYAFIEKNYWQMMDFLMTNRMTGRFQQLMMAAGEKQADIFKSKTTKTSNIAGNDPSADFTDTQVAVAHQAWGSTPEQRGVSMTSTERRGVTFGNGGLNFRDKDGFRLKVDLSKVPENALLLNHYAEGGVADMAQKDYEATVGETSYKYMESVTKNRELYLDHIEPDWVVEIEHHPTGGYQETPSEEINVYGGISGFDAGGIAPLKNDFFNKFKEGFDAHLKGGDEIEDKNFKNGASVAKLLKEGFAFGKKENELKGVVNSLEAFEEIMNDNAFVDGAEKKKPLQKQMTPFLIGYVRARVGGAMFQDAEDYGAAMNSFKGA